MKCFWLFYFTRFQKSGSKNHRNDIFLRRNYTKWERYKRKLRNMPRLTAFGCFIHWWLGALLKTFPSISNGIQHFARDLLNPAKGTQMIYSQMISHNFNQWIHGILIAIYHKSIFFFSIHKRANKKCDFFYFRQYCLLNSFFFFFFNIHISC